MKHGYGVYNYYYGTKYEGHFRNGVPHGRGVELFADGSRYEG